MSTSRRLAVDLLVRIDEGAFAHALVPAALGSSGLDARDRAFVTELVSGTVRRRGSLDFLIEQVADRPLAELDPRVRAGLRLGAYQLVSGTPSHAAVAATVDAAGGRGRGYVNAVLRTLAGLRERWPWPEGDDPAAIAVRTSHPEWLVERLVAELGREDARGMLESANDPPALTLRPNPARAAAAELRARLSRSGAIVERGRLVPEAVVVRGGGDPARMPVVAEGWATPQDEASQAVAALVGAEPGEDVLEVGAAPGGKATALAERGARVVAVDVDHGRLGMLGRARARLGIDVALVAGDGRALPMRSSSFDRILVDAPCSGLGVLRRRPDARWSVTAARIPVLAELQRDLLRDAARVVRPGGLLVYAVCTVSAAETVETDEWARAALEHFEALPAPGAPWQHVGRGARLLPQARGTDGMYVLRLRRGDAGDAGTVAS